MITIHSAEFGKSTYAKAESAQVSEDHLFVTVHDAEGKCIAMHAVGTVDKLVKEAAEVTEDLGESVAHLDAYGSGYEQGRFDERADIATGRVPCPGSNPVVHINVLNADEAARTVAREVARQAAGDR